MRALGWIAAMLLATSAAHAAPRPIPASRAATRAEGLERTIAANDIACLVRVLRVAHVAPSDTTGHLSHFASVEPVEWLKGALDYDDSLLVYLPEDRGRTAAALRAIAASRGDGAVLFFSDLGGYWRVDETYASPCGDHVGVLRVAAGRWKAELARLQEQADRVSLSGLARRADLVVLADCAPEPGAAGRFARATVTDCLKGARPAGPVRVAQGCTPLAGRQLLFLRRAGAGAFEPLPFALPTRVDPSRAHRDRLAEELEQVRESLGDQAIPE